MKISIFGKGFVGGTVYEGLKIIGHKVFFFDPKYENSNSLSEVCSKDIDIVFICVPTNPKENGECDISIVENVLETLRKYNYPGIIAIKSTVIPGTTEKLIKKYENEKICHVPEFLRERCAISDFLDNMDILVVGSKKREIAEKIFDVHKFLPKDYVWTSPTEAELIKYFNNVYNALRITFANGFYEVCKKLGADYQKIYQAVIKRNTISGHYLRCSENIRGFDGYCLPKDSRAFSEFVKRLDLEIKPEIFEVVVKDNKKYPKNVLEGMRMEKEVIDYDY